VIQLKFVYSKYHDYEEAQWKRFDLDPFLFNEEKIKIKVQSLGKIAQA